MCLHVLVHVLGTYVRNKPSQASADSASASPPYPVPDEGHEALIRAASASGQLLGQSSRPTLRLALCLAGHDEDLYEHSSVRTTKTCLSGRRSSSRRPGDVMTVRAR